MPSRFLSDRRLLHQEVASDPFRFASSAKCTILFVHLGSFLQLSLTEPDRRIMGMLAQDDFISHFEDHDIWQVQCNRNMLDSSVSICDDLVTIIEEYGLRRINCARVLVAIIGIGRVQDSLLAELCYPKTILGD